MIGQHVPCGTGKGGCESQLLNDDRGGYGTCCYYDGKFWIFNVAKSNYIIDRDI